MKLDKEEMRVAGIAVGVFVAFSLIGALGRKISRVMDKVAEELSDMAINVKSTSPLDVEGIVDPDKKENPPE